MFKLLTDKTKEKVMHEYVLRRMIVIMCSLIAVFFIGIIGILPSYVLSNARQNEVLERTRVMNSIGQEGGKPDLENWLLQTNERLRELSPKLDTDRPSDFVDKVISQSLKGVRITGFSWIKTGDSIVLSVGGVATDRQTLLMFERRLNASGYFSEVTLPISNLVKDKDIDFQIKFPTI